MKVLFSRKFDKAIDALKDKKRKSEVSAAVKTVISAKSMHDIANLKKLKGHSTAYRIRTGSYRIGVFIEKDTHGECQVEFSAFAHRKGVYDVFP